MKKIVNIKKFVISLAVLVLLLFLCGFGIVKSIYSCNDIDYKTIYVTRGDTL